MNVVNKCDVFVSLAIVDNSYCCHKCRKIVLYLGLIVGLLEKSVKSFHFTSYQVDITSLYWGSFLVEADDIISL